MGLRSWRRGGAPLAQGLAQVWRRCGAGVTTSSQQPTAIKTATTTTATIPNKRPDRRQRNQAHGQTRRPGRGRWCSIASPLAPCVLCLAEAEAQRSRLVVSTFQVGRSVDRLRALARHARAPRSTGRARSVQIPAPMPGVWLLAFETTTSSLTLARRLSSPRSTRLSSCLVAQVSCRDTRVRSFFAGRHFEFVRRSSR